METNFNSKELDTLMDALDAWEKKDFGMRLMGGLFKHMIGKDDPITKAKMEEDERIENEKMEREERQRKEISVMLKAKLIGIKQSIEIASL